MQDGIQTLSTREAEVLRLLLAGHDAKSVARTLGLSVHTINERLRDARRKLGVSSSREAARILAEVEQANPEYLVDKKIVPASETTINSGLNGVSVQPSHNLSADEKLGVAQSSRLTNTEGNVEPRSTGDVGKRRSKAWIVGGVAGAMSLIAAALIYSLQGTGEVPPASAPVDPQAMDVMPIADTNGDGKVTAEEYQFFSEQGWGVVSQGKEQVKLLELDEMSQMAFFGILPNADGAITRQMFVDAIPARFKLFDHNGDGTLSPDEINGRAFAR